MITAALAVWSAGAAGTVRTRTEILDDAAAMRAANAAEQARLRDAVSLDAYRALVRRDADGRAVWSDALQRALDEHEIVRIPPSSEPYWTDRTVRVPSRRRIEAAGAVVRAVPGMTTVLLRNVHTADGTRMPIAAGSRDANIAVTGGRWEESHTRRLGYGRSGKYDAPSAEQPFRGVSTCFLFNNIDGVTLKDLTFAHCAGFAVQVGDIRRFSADRIRFESCYADGLHINGNTELVYATDVKGDVGDDLVALNAYDWQNSSVNFGPIRRVACDDLELAPSGRYKAIRILPGLYTFRDGSRVDCAVTDLVMSRVKGILVYKVYFQTPAYKIRTQKPEAGAIGTADNLHFADLDIDLNAPIDNFAPYRDSDPVRGTMAAFEFGSKVGTVHFDNIRLTLHRDRYPHSYFACVGPKSVLTEKGVEIFNPQISSAVEHLRWRNVSVNGKPVDDLTPYLREIRFDDVNRDGFSTGAGRFRNVSRDATSHRGVLSGAAPTPPLRSRSNTEIPK